MKNSLAQEQATIKYPGKQGWRQSGRNRWPRREGFRLSRLFIGGMDSKYLNPTPFCKRQQVKKKAEDAHTSSKRGEEKAKESGVKKIQFLCLLQLEKKNVPPSETRGRRLV